MSLVKNLNESNFLQYHVKTHIFIYFLVINLEITANLYSVEFTQLCHSTQKENNSCKW